MSYKSRFPQIEVELVGKMDALARAAAERVEQIAKERVPVDTGRLKEAIHVDREGVAEYSVVAGNNTAWYGIFVENGGAHTGARPFMVPAAEQTRAEIPALGKAALRSL